MAENFKDKKVKREIECLLDNKQSKGKGIQSIQPGANITVDNTDPKNPIISSSGGGTGDGSVNVTSPITGSGLSVSPVGILPASSSTRGTMSIAHFNKLDNVDFSSFMLTTSPANSITNTNISNWNTAYGWGDHSIVGYTTSNSTDTFTNKSGNISQWTNDLSYITSTSLNTTLASYVTNTSLTTTLGNYVTNSSLSTTLSSYVTTTALTTGLNLKENLSNKVTTWSGTPNNNNYPSEKLVKDSLDALVTGLSQPIKTISSNTTIDDTYHNAIVRITSNVNITVPNTLRADFNCVFEAIGAITGTFVEGGSSVFSAPFGKLLRDNSMCNLYKYTTTNFRLNGGLVPV